MEKIFLIIAILSFSSLFAQTRKAGIDGAAFLKVGVGARQVGIGSAATSLSEDVLNMYWNPAGIALKEEQSQASFTYNSWIAGLKQNAFAGSMNFDGIGTLGIGFMSFGISGIPADRDYFPNDPALSAIQIDKNGSSTYDYLDMVVQLSYAHNISDQLSLGATVKVISEKIDDQHASALAFDFGSLYHIGILNWNIGARMNNLGGDLTFYDYGSPIPLTFSIGTSMIPISFSQHTFMIALDAVKPQDGQQYYYGGVEYGFNNILFLRGGWKFNYSYSGQRMLQGGIDEGTSDPNRGTIRTSLERGSLGAGVKTNVEGYWIGVDYAYTLFDKLDNVHRITLHIATR